ncbi:hypothetical protein BOX15_Mlig017079g3 [Macrostomum lignano]|uniref:RING-CH-type domain-containing protein n=1 Tax=Macrostomum lignano TaxID=282301 RepID=A0A267E213_9PLAT|nr:hypothetical protein BOX15_Mlig017079g2 [Macrostomum lignano]PAA77455.1 hypothetical protein BOX15_Mlig017079g3 [Macrostomum lignano]
MQASIFSLQIANTNKKKKMANESNATNNRSRSSATTATTARDRSRSPPKTIRSSSTKTATTVANAQSDDNRCRICRSSSADDNNQPLLNNLCNCRGSVGSAHADCVTNWLRRSLQIRCELCGAAYPLWVVPKRALARQHNLEMDALEHQQDMQWEERRLQLARRMSRGNSLN